MNICRSSWERNNMISWPMTSEVQFQNHKMLVLLRSDPITFASLRPGPDLIFLLNFLPDVLECSIHNTSRQKLSWMLAWKLCWFKEKNTKTCHFVLALQAPLFCCASDVPCRHFIHNTYLSLLLRFCMRLNCSTRSQTPQVLGLCLTEWKPWL